MTERMLFHNELISEDENYQFYFFSTAHSGLQANRALRKTRRERLKLALHLRLKKRKGFKIVKDGPLGLFQGPGCGKI